MIRICKNADKPQTLDKSYNTDEVCKQLLMDHRMINVIYANGV